MGSNNPPFAFGRGLPYFGLSAGLSTEFGTWLPPGAQVTAYVRATEMERVPREMARRRVPTLAAALAQVQNPGDIVYVMPGHTENVTDATMLDNLQAGTRIIGMGCPDQDDAPTFTWSAEASNWTLDQKNVLIQGLRLQMNGANSITECVTVTGAGCKMVGNYINFGSGASNDCDIGISIEADGFTLSGNDIEMSGGTAVSPILVPDSASSDRLKIHNNLISCILSGTTNGVIEFGDTACLRIHIADNYIANRTAASTHCIKWADDVATTGLVHGNYLGTLANANPSSGGGFSVAGTTNIDLHFFENYHCDGEGGVTGLLAPAAATN